MTTTWTAEQILALAPDSSSAKAGKDLANPRKWVTLGYNEKAVWGECQGSGKLPYQTQIDLSEPVFKCSCPSRKLPCKHGLGLFLLLEKQIEVFNYDNEPPAWVAEWLEGRARRAEQKAAKRQDPASQASDKTAQAKRAAERQSKAEAGIQDLEVWLADRVRQGLVAVQGQGYNFWDTPAARLVDAQLPGMGRMVREMATIPASGDGWQARLLERLGKLHLLVEGFKRIDSLPPENQADIRSLMGWTQNQEELLAKEGITDYWLVVGQQVEEQERLRVQRTWLQGKNSQREALILNFAIHNQPLDSSFAVGRGFEGELVFFPAAYPLRAVIKSRPTQFSASHLPFGYETIKIGLKSYSAALSRNLWLEEFPMSLQKVVPLRDGENWLLCDGENYSLPITPGFNSGWDLLALSGSHPFDVFGEYDGNYFLPLSVWKGDKSLSFENEAGRNSRYNVPGFAPWPEVVAAALVGTERQTPNFPVNGALGSILSSLDPANKESYLLSAAGLLAMYGRSGNLLTLYTQPLPEASERDDKPVCSPRSRQHLTTLLNRKYKEILPEWLEAVASAELRIPEESLPALLDEGADNTYSHPAIRAVIGQRGNWLVAQNPKWQYLVENSEIDENTWQTGTQAQRLELSVISRTQNPVQGRELIVSTWASEKADDRVSFLDALETNLSMDDEPFLETVLDDRSKEVRRTAAKLLARLPESRLCQRMRERTQDHLIFIPMGEASALDVKLPSQFDKTMERDGIEQKKTAGEGEKSSWLLQMLAATPLSVWTEKFGKAPAELIEAAYKGEWYSVLGRGWTQAALSQHNQAWAEAILDFSVRGLAKGSSGIAVDSNLLALLPPPQREAYTIAVLKEHGNIHRDHPASYLLFECQSPWSVELSRTVLESLRGAVASSTNKYDYYLHSLFSSLGRLIHVSLADEASRGWPEEGQAWSYLAKAVQDFIALLQFRREMLQELTK